VGARKETLISFVGAGRVAACSHQELCVKRRLIMTAGSSLAPGFDPSPDQTCTPSHGHYARDVLNTFSGC